MSSNVGLPDLEGKLLDTLSAVSSLVEPTAGSSDYHESGAPAPEHQSPATLSLSGNMTATSEIHVDTSDTLPLSASSVSYENKSGDKTAAVGDASSKNLAGGSAGNEVLQPVPAINGQGDDVKQRQDSEHPNEELPLVVKTSPLPDKSENDSEVPENISPSSSNTGLKFVDRVMDLPIVQMGYDVYLQAQEKSPFAMPLSLLKGFATVAYLPASMIATPLSRVCGVPISTADYLLCKGLDVTETVFPCITLPPDQIFRCLRLLRLLWSAASIFQKTLSKE